MLEKIKCGLKSVFTLTKIRMPLIIALAVITVGVSTLLGYSVETFHISDGENTYTVRTLDSNMDNVLSTVNLKFNSYRITNLNRHSSVTDVDIEYLFPVYITVGEETTVFETGEATVGEILTAVGFIVDEHDMVEPSLDTLVTKSCYIDYVNIDYVSGTYNEAIPFETETVYSASLNEGTKQMVQSGTEGVRTVSYSSKYINGVAVETSVLSSEVVSAAVNAKQIVGTKKVVTTPPAVKTSADVKAVSTLTPSSPIALDANGNPVKFKKKMTVQATAYTYTGNNCSTGVAPQPGYIAVNPSVIPYGTKMYIKTPDGGIVYGYAVAADTGGFIKRYPTNVDLFYSTHSACVSFGRRNVEIYILE